ADARTHGPDTPDGAQREHPDRLASVACQVFAVCRLDDIGPRMPEPAARLTPLHPRHHVPLSTVRDLFTALERPRVLPHPRAAVREMHQEPVLVVAQPVPHRRLLSIRRSGPARPRLPAGLAVARTNIAAMWEQTESGRVRHPFEPVILIATLAMIPS